MSRKICWMVIFGVFSISLGIAYAGTTTYSEQEILNRIYRDSSGSALSLYTAYSSQGILNMIYNSSVGALNISRIGGGEEQAVFELDDSSDYQPTENGLEDFSWESDSNYDIQPRSLTFDIDSSGDLNPL